MIVIRVFWIATTWNKTASEVTTARRLSDKADPAPPPVFACMGCCGQAVRRKTVASVASKTWERVAAVIELNPCGLLNSTTDLA